MMPMNKGTYFAAGKTTIFKLIFNYVLLCDIFLKADAKNDLFHIFLVQNLQRQCNYMKQQHNIYRFGHSSKSTKIMSKTKSFKMPPATEVKLAPHNHKIMQVVHFHSNFGALG